MKLEKSLLIFSSISGGVVASIPFVIAILNTERVSKKQIPDFFIICGLRDGGLDNGYDDTKFPLSTSSIFNGDIMYSVNTTLPEISIIDQNGSYELEIKQGLNSGNDVSSEFDFSLIATFIKDGYETKVINNQITFTVYGTQQTGNMWGRTSLSDSRVFDIPNGVYYNEHYKKLFNNGFGIYDPYVSDELALEQQTISAGAAPGYWITWQIEVDRTSGQQQWLDKLNSQALGKILFGLQDTGNPLRPILYISNISFGNDLFEDGYSPSDGQKSEYNIVVTLNAPGFVTQTNTYHREILYHKVQINRGETLPDVSLIYNQSLPSEFINSIVNQPINYSRFWFNVSKSAPTSSDLQNIVNVFNFGDAEHAFAISPTYGIEFNLEESNVPFETKICDNGLWKSESEIGSSSNWWLKPTTHLISNGDGSTSNWLEVEVLIFSSPLIIINVNWPGNDWVNDMTNWFIQKPAL